MTKVVGIIIGMLSIIACATTSNPQLTTQMAATQEFFKSVPFTALVGFHVHGYHYIDPNGKPLEGKKQSKRKGGKGLFTKKYAVAKGEQGYVHYIAQRKDRLIVAGVSTSKGGLGSAWNPSTIEIHFPRAITEEDITPESLTRTFSSLMVFEGLEPGSELDGFLKELEKPADK